MNESILGTIRKMIGGEENANYFDSDLLIHINSAIYILYQLGVGDEPFVVDSADVTWDDYLDDNYKHLELIKQYIYYQVRNSFDTPQTSFVLTNINDKIKELEWRINVEVDK